MFTMIQSAKQPNKRSVIRLAPGAYVSPAGYVVGEYCVVFPSVTRHAALRLLARLFQRGSGVSLWWHGAAEDVAQYVTLAK